MGGMVGKFSIDEKNSQQSMTRTSGRVRKYLFKVLSESAFMYKGLMFLSDGDGDELWCSVWSP